MMCHRIGWPPISTSGFGRMALSSLMAFLANARAVTPGQYDHFHGVSSKLIAILAKP